MDGSMVRWMVGWLDGLRGKVKNHTHLQEQNNTKEGRKGRVGIGRKGRVGI